MITAMKKILLLAAAAIMAAGAMQAKTADELRVYLNPGHGSWGPNDRPMATIPYPALAETGRPDTCGFYESNTNLWKILKMGETLQTMGVKAENIMYSRVKNGPYPYVSGAADAELFNRSLSEISREVDANNMDIFVSIHSNAATDGTTTNYPLYLYRGQDKSTGENYEHNEGSYEMCEAGWDARYMTEIDPNTYYSRTNRNIRGDWNFYGSTYQTTTSKGTFTGYLGVLRHGTPGYLVEGYFHTYQPARHRALNSDYCGQEGKREARGLCSYFGLKAETTGDIMGTVKDLHEKITNNLFKYNPGTDDQYLPLNGAVVTLKQNGAAIATYNVDNNYNGVFVFEGLQPGDYTLVATCEGYKGMEVEEPITVTANATNYALLHLESESYEPPSARAANYPDLINTEAIKLAGEYNFKTIVDKAAAEVLDGKTVRRVLQKGEDLYVLAINATDNAPSVYQINAKTQQVVKEISTEGTQGDVLKLSDIAFTADGVLIGCNKVNTTYAGSGEFRAYKWDNLDEAPTQWFTSKLSGNFNAAVDGQTLAYSGTSKEGKLMTSAVTTGSSKQIRWLIFGIENGDLATNIRNQESGTYTELLFGEDFSLKVSPRSEESFIIDGSLTTPIEITLAGDIKAPTVEGKVSPNLVDAASNQPAFFKFAGQDVMVIPAISEGKVVSVDMYNITDGLQNATLITTNATPVQNGPKKIAVENSAACSFAGANAVVTVATDDMEVVTDANITVSLLSDKNISLYSTEGAQQPEFRGDYAYDLKYEEADDTYTLKFKVTRDVKNAVITLTSTEENASEISYNYGAAVATGNEFTVNKSDLAEGVEYNWSVTVDNDAVPTVSKFFSYAPAGNGSYCSRGMTIDRNTESPYFQNLYIANPYGTKGIYEVNPALEVVNDGAPYLKSEWYTSSTSSPFRMGVNPNNGFVYISDWCDAHGGITVMDPADPNTAIPFFEGTRAASGQITNAAGQAIGGSCTSVAFVGSGEDTQLVSYQEDVPTGNAGNHVSIYNIGTKVTTDQAPDAQLTNCSGLLANTNVEVNPLENGIFVSQIRGSGNNTKGVPSFIYIDYEGNVLFNSADIEDYDGSYGAGLAVSDDLSMIAVSTGKPYVNLYDVEWDGNTPSFKLRFTVTAYSGAGSILNQMKFDHAGNLFVADAKTGIFGISIPKDAQQVETPAQLSQILKNSPVTAVDDVTAKTVKSVKYYNTLGAQSATPFEGINIVVTTYTDGTQSSTKVIK